MKHERRLVLTSLSWAESLPMLSRSHRSGTLSLQLTIELRRSVGPPASAASSWMQLGTSCGGYSRREESRGSGNAIPSAVSCSISLRICEGADGGISIRPLERVSDEGFAGCLIIPTDHK